MKRFFKYLSASAAVLTAQTVRAELPVTYEAEAIGTYSTGDFAPYYIASNRHGILTQSNDALLRVSAVHDWDTSSKWSYGFGIEAVTGYSSETDYLRYDHAANSLQPHGENAPAVWLQQLYGEVKYRSLFLSVGMKSRVSPLVDFSLASGDLVESGNARPIPQVRAGFIDFQDIPLTRGWIQIQGEVSYGKMADNPWMRDHYNYYNYHINLGGLYTYKRLYFRTNPDKPLSGLLGMQSAGLFGGTTTWYNRGEQTKVQHCKSGPREFLRMLIPIQNEGSAYFDGNSLGSWDLALRYRFNGGQTLRAYIQKPWEDGSGIGWLNGFDGVWGVEYKANAPRIIDGAVIEYLDFTNQSGQMHWAPHDNPGTTITTQSTGGDEYYNNYLSNSYMNYGMSIGTPFLPSPLYNTDGYMAYVHNRVRGVHAGISGTPGGGLTYRLLGSYRTGWGDSRYPTAAQAHDFSMMLEASYTIPRVAGLNVSAQLAFDSGNIYGDCFGACVSLKYTGLLKLFGK